MSLEQDLKETLARHAERARPRADAFTGVERKVRRAHRRRLAAVTAGGLALIAAAAIAMPQLMSNGGDPEGFADPSETAEPVPAPEGYTAFRHERAGIQLAFPEDWRVGGFEGSVEFNPPDEPGLTVGEPTTAVELMVLSERYDNAEGDWSAAGTIGGRDAVSRAAGDYATLYRVDWTGAACTPGAVCDAEIMTLQILVHASDLRRHERWSDAQQAILTSIEPTHTAAYPSGLVRTPRGSVGPNVAYDERTALLVRFLEARVADGGAESLMTDDAIAAYETVPGLDLYRLGEGQSGWLEYRVSGRTDDAKAGAAFDVDLTSSFIEGHGPSGTTERITISGNLVTDAEVIGDFTA